MQFDYPIIENIGSYNVVNPKKDHTRPIFEIKINCGIFYTNKIQIKGEVVVLTAITVIYFISILLKYLTKSNKYSHHYVGYIQ